MPGHLSGRCKLALGTACPARRMFGHGHPSTGASNDPVAAQNARIAVPVRCVDRGRGTVRAVLAGAGSLVPAVAPRTARRPRGGVVAPGGWAMAGVRTRAGHRVVALACSADLVGGRGWRADLRPVHGYLVH